MQKPGSPRAALLIDADNFHDPGQLQAVHAQFAQHAGKHFICHAHGGAQVLARETLKPVWQALAARLIPALPLPKNTTDTALVIDALLLHFQYGVNRFGIVSGDADFAPLSLQLRELGCEVWCFARMAIAFEHMPSYYDKVVRFDRPPSPPAAPAPVPLPTPVSRQAPVPVPAPLSTRAAHDVSVVRVLELCPGLQTQTPQPLNTTVRTLRQKGLMGKNAKASVWFSQFGGMFKLVLQPGVTSTICWQPSARTVEPVLSSAPSRLATKHVTVADVLLAVPELLGQSQVQVDKVASILKARGMAGSDAMVHQILGMFPVQFELTPEHQPEYVRYRG